MTQSLAPAPIRIDDLGEPRLTETQRAIISQAPTVELNADHVLNAAQAATGLSDFGAPDFRERLAVWLQSFEEDRELSPLGRAVIFGDCIRLASNRLRLEDIYKRHPEIDAVQIDRPIIIAGLPRSGTTNLVNMLAADPRLRSMPMWETMEPLPIPGEEGDPDPRHLRAQAIWGQIEQTLPLLPAMHEVEPHLVHEDVELQGLDFSGYVPEWYGRPYRWRDYYYAHDQTPHYGYAKRVLKAMTWLRGPNRWVLKSPPHMENFGPIANVYPDAITVVIHRDPIAVLQSAVTMLTYGERLRRTRIDLQEAVAYWIDRIEHMLRACVRDRALLPAGQSLDLLFHDYMRDQETVTAQVLDMAGLPQDAQSKAQTDAYIRANPRGRHGQILYDLEGDFGVKVGEIRERFQFYYDRYPVKQEPVKGETL